MRIPLTLLVTTLAAAATQTGAPLEYRFEEIKSKVVVEHEGAERRVSEGDVAFGADLLRTGWLGRAEFSAPAAASRFVVYASTHVRLGDERPEVLVILERGKLEAIFDALTGNAERLVATPGAVLAVRGTRYGLEVDRDGEAVLAVFEGCVEVRPNRPDLAPVSVEAGHLCRFGPQTPPRKAQAPRGFDEGAWRRRGATGDIPRSQVAPGERANQSQPGGAPGGQQPRGRGKGGGL